MNHFEDELRGSLQRAADEIDPGTQFPARVEQAVAYRQRVRAHARARFALAGLVAVAGVLGVFAATGANSTAGPTALRSPLGEAGARDAPQAGSGEQAAATAKESARAERDTSTHAGADPVPASQPPGPAVGATSARNRAPDDGRAPSSSVTLNPGGLGLANSGGNTAISGTIGVNIGTGNATAYPPIIWSTTTTTTRTSSNGTTIPTSGPGESHLTGSTTTTTTAPPPLEPPPVP